jgi:hypothetical protein
MILPVISAMATILLVVALAAQRRWIRLLTGLLIWLMIAYVLLFYSGSVARTILQPGPPSGNAAAVFYLGVQMLQEALLDSYLAVIYLSLLSFVNSAWRRDLKP